MPESGIEVEEIQEPFTIVPEHLEDHDTLLTTSEYVAGDFQRTAESRTAVSLVMNDIFFHPQFDGRILELHNSNRLVAELGRFTIVGGDVEARRGELFHALMQSIMLPNGSPIYQAMEEGRYEDVTFDTGSGGHRPHIRDHFVLTITHRNERAMLIPLQHARRHEEERLMPLKERLGVRMAVTMASFEGGNMLGDGVNNYTLSETLGDNKEVYEGNAVRVLDANFGIAGEKLIYLDGGEFDDQPVYHLDLAVSFLQGPDGSTVALLSSLRLAAKLLRESGVKGNIKVKDWFKNHVARQYQREFSRRHAGSLLREISRAGSGVQELIDQGRGLGLESDWLIEYAKGFIEQNADLPHLTHKAIGGSLPVFLTRRNYDPVQGYLDRIGEGLERCGIHVIEVPALILKEGRAGSFDRFSLSYAPGDSVAKAGVSNVPNYCPVNGVTYNGGRRMFFSIGGIIQFDRYMKRELGKLGYLYAPLRNAVTMGWSQAGMHCGFMPFGLG